MGIVCLPLVTVHSACTARDCTVTDSAAAVEDANISEPDQTGTVNLNAGCFILTTARSIACPSFIAILQSAIFIFQ